MARGSHSSALAISAPDDALEIVGCALSFSDLNYCTYQVPDHASKETVRLEREPQPVGPWLIEHGPEHVTLGRGGPGTRCHEGGKVVSAVNPSQTLLHRRKGKGPADVPGIIAQERRWDRTVKYVIFVHLAHG
jgi:hypothetical protein